METEDRITPRIIYSDKRIVVCVKPAGVLSTDEPGGMPSLIREALGELSGCVRTVHRLDRVTGGLMVLARSRAAASILGQEIADGRFEKEYLAVLRGAPEATGGTLRDLLARDRVARRSYVTDAPGKDVREAVLEYRVLETRDGGSLIRVRLRTGRTHQIRAQFAARGLPLAGDVKYGAPAEPYGPALWSCRLAFRHPETGEAMDWFLPPPETAPWDQFTKAKELQWNT